MFIHLFQCLQLNSDFKHISYFKLLRLKKSQNIIIIKIIH